MDATTTKPDKAPGPTIQDFEAHTFEVQDFDHEAHVYVAWLYVQQHDLLEAIERFRATLIRLTEDLGIQGRYHETITWFYMIAVAEGAVDAAASDWDLFKVRNPALFRRNPSIIRRYYSERRLVSDEARSSFLLPDLAATG